MSGMLIEDASRQAIRSIDSLKCSCHCKADLKSNIINCNSSNRLEISNLALSIPVTFDSIADPFPGIRFRP